MVPPVAVARQGTLVAVSSSTVPYAELRSRLQDLVLRYGLYETLDREHFYPTLKAAIRDVEAAGPPDPS